MQHPVSKRTTVDARPSSFAAQFANRAFVKSARWLAALCGLQASVGLIARILGIAALATAVSLGTSGCSLFSSPKSPTVRDPSTLGSVEGYAYYRETAAPVGPWPYESSGTRGIELVPQTQVNRTASEAEPVVLVYGEAGGVPDGYLPLAGATVHLSGTNLTAVSGPDGRFRIDGVWPGTYDLDIVHDSFPGIRIAGIRVVAGGITLVNYPVGAVFYLIIGINDYQNPGMNDLSYCVDDARSIYDAVARQSKWRGEARIFVDWDATKANIYQAIMEVASKMNPQDHFVMYYSGHGGQLQDAYGRLEEVILPADTDPQRRDTMITDDELISWISQIPGTNKVLIFDSCYSGGMIPGRAQGQVTVLRPSLDGLARTLSGMGAAVMTAAAPDEYSWESYYLGHGIFTYFLAEALGYPAGAAGDASLLRSFLRADQPPYGTADQVVTVSEAFEYAATRTTDYASTHLGVTQTPQLYVGPEGEDRVLLRY